MSSISYNPNISSDYNQPSQDDMEYSQSSRPSQSRPTQSRPTQSRQKSNIKYSNQIQPTSFDNYNPYDYNPIPTNNINYGRIPRKQNYELFSDGPSEEEKKTKFDWLKFGKSIAIYTILFLIMSHVKMNEFVCNFIPLLKNDEVLCMTVKGIIMSIIIIVIQKML